MASIIHSDQRIFKTFAKTETLIRDNYFTNIFRTHISKHDQNSETPDPKISKNMVNVKMGIKYLSGSQNLLKITVHSKRFLFSSCYGPLKRARGLIYSDDAGMGGGGNQAGHAECGNSLIDTSPGYHQPRGDAESRDYGQSKHSGERKIY